LIIPVPRKRSLEGEEEAIEVMVGLRNGDMEALRKDECIRLYLAGEQLCTFSKMTCRIFWEAGKSGVTIATTFLDIGEAFISSRNRSP
jgi:hypothetical protein